MESIITACISAAAVIIAGMMTWNYYWRKLGDDVKDQTNGRQTEHEKLFREHQDIKDNISREHQDIKDNISREHQDIRDNMSREHQDIKNGITQMLIEQQKQQAAREEAGKQIPQELALLKMVESIYDHNQKIVNENIQLKELVAQQQNQLEKQQKQMKKLKQRIRSKNPDWGDEVEL